MKLARRRFLQAATGTALLAVIPRIALAQPYPARSVRMIVPFEPGGMVDTAGRLIAQKLSEHFGRRYYVENVPGAGRNIGRGRAAQSAADGYTLAVFDSISYVVNPTLFSTPLYDPGRDFEAITMPVSTTQVLTVHPSLPVHTVKELVELIKANPGKFSYASAGIGSASHLTSEPFRTSLGLDLIQVPFNGAGPAVTSTMGGHTPIAFSSPTSSTEQIKQGALRALAVASKTRSAPWRWQARRDCPPCPTCQLWPKPAFRRSSAMPGSGFWLRLERQNKSSPCSTARSAISSRCLM